MWIQAQENFVWAPKVVYSNSGACLVTMPSLVSVITGCSSEAGEEFVYSILVCGNRVITTKR